MRVLISVPKDPAQHAGHTIEIGDFFRRNPMADFSKVSFLYPDVNRKRKAGRQKKNQMNDIIAVFDSSLFKDNAMEIQRRADGCFQAKQSKSHALLLFSLFGEKLPTERGETKELLLKLTPVKEGDDRESRKVCRITKFIRSVESLSKQRVPSK